jgi:Mce-associated membrane protein
MTKHGGTTRDETSEPVGAQVDDTVIDTETVEDAADASATRAPGQAQTRRWMRSVAANVLPVVALVLTVAAGFLRYQDSSLHESRLAQIDSVRAATESTVALLSYKPDTVEKDLGAARNRTTGDFKNAYTSLTHDVVIPGAKQKHISATATVPAAASVSATANHAVALVFVDQTVIVGNDAPTMTASSVRVSLDKVGEHWLISGFDPV